MSVSGQIGMLLLVFYICILLVQILVGFICFDGEVKPMARIEVVFFGFRIGVLLRTKGAWLVNWLSAPI